MTLVSSDTIVTDFGSHVEHTFASVASEHPYTQDSHSGIRQSLNAYRSALRQLYGIIEKRHNNKASGQMVCALLTELIDRLIIHSYRFFFPEAEKDPGFAIIALGGYGRCELNPHSDIDILFLSQGPFDESMNHSIRTMLQFLWDLNLDLGHSTRTMEECMAAARDDTYLATSLLESRFITGNTAIWNEFRERYSEWLREGAGKQIVMQKIEERIQRLEFFHGTVHIQEPNVKECPGALRDIHTARWLLLLTEQGGTLRDLFKSDLFSVSEKTVFEDGLDFLLRVRNTLHFLAGKKADVLDRLSLPDVAKKLRYRGEGVTPIEKFMRDYYMSVGRVRQLTDLIVDEFVARFSQKGSMPFAPVSKELRANDRAVALNNENAESVRIRPGLLVEIFAVAGARGINLTRSTSSHIENNLQRLGDDLLKHDEIRTAFHDLVNMREGTAHALRLMHEHGILTKLIPEFEVIRWHYQYDFYHTYTTDEHSLRVIENLENIFTGNNSADPEISNLMQEVTAQSALCLAGLLHDIGKGGGAAHSQRSDRMAVRALRRLGFDERTIQIVRFLIREHLLISHISQRRDMDDEDTINDFIERVFSSEQLRMLTLLTFADLMALSSDALTDWKRALIWSLYNKALMRIDRRFESTVSGSRRNRINRFVKKMESVLPRKVIRDHLNNLPEQYIRVTTPATIKKHIEGIERMKKKGAWASFRRKGELSMLTVIAPDHPRALSDICGAITSSDISIIRAQIFTRNDGIIIDTFHVVNGNSEALIAPETQREFKRNLPKIFAGKLDVQDLIQSHIRRWRRRRKKIIYSPPRVRVHNDISTKYTVIDLFATDYTGLLYDITSVLAQNGMDIHTAKIGTDEDQVADAFYIQKDGKKISDEEMIERLTAEIIERLTEAYI